MEQIRIKPHLERTPIAVDGLTLKLLGWICVIAGAVATVFYPADSMASGKMLIQMGSYLGFPIFTFLLVQGFLHTSNFRKYLLCVLAAALIAEPFYDFACTGTWFAYYGSTGQNPLLGLALCLVMLYFLRYVGTSGFGRILVCVFVAIAAVIWSVLLNIRYGAFLVTITALFYLLRNHKVVMNVLIGAIGTFLYFSPALALILTGLYSQTRKDYPKYIFYVLYPAVWIGFAIVKLLL